MSTALSPAGPPAGSAHPRPPLLTDPDLAATLDRFAGAFTTLSRLLLAAPPAAVLGQVRDPGLLAHWPLPDHPECRRGVALLGESATAREAEAKIRTDYNRLFVGPERLKAPPYESVHRSPDHLVFDRETLEVRAAYAQFGLAAPRLNQEPDDHIGLELGFLATLCVLGLDAIEADDDGELARVLDALVAFLRDHVLRWASRCLTQVADGSATYFYQGVAALGLGTFARARETFLS
ncbi:TorD/DmsD family molecular chaperone [Georgenia thermotolerans]|uniref:TorD/DmsD family molecular chaperone n=1 Tax=Georgenia thermotolerans TaxID=527326 RepID=UPI001B8B4B98|nr:molecular chaperone TorD family protein [Georgenia thermotolerans]